MKRVMAVGLESTLDVIITFPDLKDFKKFSDTYDGELADKLKEGYKIVESGHGDEVPIDGAIEGGKVLLQKAGSFGATLSYLLGGNGAQQAAAMKCLGNDTIYVGGVSSSCFVNLQPGIRRLLGDIDMSFAKNLDDCHPRSYIMQAPDSNRYILCNGKGRRIDQIRDYLAELPDTLEKVIGKYGRLDSLSLVGWHVLFANGVSDSDLNLVKRVTEEIREKTDVPIFTDTGGLSAFDDEQKKRLFKIYGMLDVLSVNEDEILQLAKGIGCDSEDSIEVMSHILDASDNLTTVWLHTPSFQASLSTEFTSENLEKAQNTAALAGMFKVEKGSYPSEKDVNLTKVDRVLSDVGLKTVEDIKKKYDGKIGDAVLTATPCYVGEYFTSTVGAGDTAAAAYAYSLVESGRPK